MDGRAGTEVSGITPNQKVVRGVPTGSACTTIYDAHKLGISIHLVNDEIIDVQRLDDRFELFSKGSRPITTRQVVLANGDFPKSIFREMAHLPGYLGSPWPLQKLDRIPVDATISVVSTSHTAVDIAPRLFENGHRGKITLFSRNGRLPKVKGPSPSLAVFRNQYILHKLARELEQDTRNAFDRILTTLASELEQIKWLHRFNLEQLDGPIHEMEADIADAENGNIGWLALLHATGPVLERYWNCLSLEDQTNFNEKYAGVWYTYRNAMPLRNAKEIHAFFQTGQLEVVSARTVTWDGSSFIVPGGEAKVRSDFLLEAAGLEYNPRLLKSPLMHQLLDSRLLKPHWTGVVSVDFWTLEVTKNFYVIGSLTRGVHFNTNSVRRIAAVRVADNILGNRICRPQHVALFVGSLSAYFDILPRILPRLFNNNHMPFVFLTAPIAKSLSAFNGQGAHIRFSEIQDLYGIFAAEIGNASSSLSDILTCYHLDIGVGIDM